MFILLCVYGTLSRSTPREALCRESLCRYSLSTKGSISMELTESSSATVSVSILLSLPGGGHVVVACTTWS